MTVNRPCHTPFSILNQSVVLCKILTVASWPPYRFLRRQVRWSGTSVSLRVFQFAIIHTVEGFSVVNETEVDVFLEFPCYLCDPANVANLVSGSSAFSKPSLNIWRFLVHIILKPSVQDFKHNLTSMGDECNCLVVWTFFRLLFLGMGIRNDLSTPVATWHQVCHSGLNKWVKCIFTSIDIIPSFRWTIFLLLDIIM